MMDIIVFFSLPVILGWFIFGLISPTKAAPFLKTPNRLKILGIFLAATFVISLFIGKDVEKKGNNQSVATTTMTEQDKAKEKQVANRAVIDALGHFYRKIDEVEKTEWFTPYEGNTPAETKIYWYVGLNQKNDINQRFKVVHFSDNIGWVFWDKLIFSTNEKNWTYDINTFAGQSGGGKSTQIVFGGKYEFFDTSLKNVIEGVRLLVNGGNPILRLKGEEHFYDIKLSQEDIKNLKNAIIFYENSQIIDEKITRDTK